MMSVVGQELPLVSVVFMSGFSRVQDEWVGVQVIWAALFKARLIWGTSCLVPNAIQCIFK